MKIRNKRIDAARYFENNDANSDLKGQAIEGATAVISSNVITFLLQFLGTVILGRLLTPNDFGLIAMVATFSFLLMNLGMRGFTEATIQVDRISHEQVSSLFWIHVAASIGIAIVFIMLSPVIVWFYDEPKLKAIAIAMSATFIFTALSTQHLALLSRNLLFERIAINDIAATFISVFSAILLAMNGWGYWALVVRRVSIPLVTAVGAWTLCKWIPGRPSIRKDIYPMIKFGINTYGNFTINYITRNLDSLLIGWRYGSPTLGNYDRAYYLFVMPVNQLSYPLTNVAVSTLSRLKNEPEEFREYYLKAVSFLAFFGMPLSAIFTLIGKDLMILLLGAKWAVAGSIFTVFGPGIGVLIIYGTHGWLHLSLGNARRWLMWGLIELFVTAIFFILALPYGASGIAIAFVLSIYILIGPGIWYAGKPIELSLSSLWSKISRYFISALISGVFSYIILYKWGRIANLYSSLNMVLRISTSFIMCLTFYFTALILLFRDLDVFLRVKGIINDIRSKYTI